MTICIAAICADGPGGVIFGASDRMLTSGAIQFEPPQRKMVDITTSIAAMVSGDMALQTEIMLELRQLVRHRIEGSPTEWLFVKDIASEYSRIHGELRRQRAVRDFLAPLGLTSDAFVARQKEMAPEIAKELTSKLLRYELPEADVIIAGNDPSGHHLYAGRNGDITCEDAAGFVAIGAGSEHAESLLMASRYVKSDSISRGLYLTFAAKKRAEIAPGVGEHTDMIMIGSQLGSFTVLRDEVIDGLRGIYEQNRVRLQEVLTDAELAAHGFVQALGRAATEAAEATVVSEQAQPPSTIEDRTGTGVPADAGGTRKTPRKRKKAQES